MTFLGRLMALYPFFLLLIIGTHFVILLLKPSLWVFASLLFFIYLFPLISYHLHNLMFPLREEIIDLAKKRYNSWWGGHQIQLLYVAVPIIEAPFHLVPGAFSWWLRIWGSKIGKNVYWTPKVEVVDRGLLDIGDKVVVGHMVAFCSHAISPVEGRMSLIVRRIKVGHRAFIGAESRFAAGANISEGQTVKYKGHFYWGGEYPL